MRSSKTRSRSKSNRNRSIGNIVNRVFDSSGPEGKVRGTPQQIIDKYNQLARDAQLANDRVAAENFQQHAEHYTRMLSEAQREQDARREQQEREQEARREQQSRDRAERQQAFADGAQGGGQGEDFAGGGEVMDTGSDAGLVETPENAPRGQRPRRSRKPRGGDQQGGGDQGGNPSGGTEEPSEAAE